MKLTKKDIESDIKFIINELKTQDVEVPSFMLCAHPGVLAFVGVVAWQTFMLWPFSKKVFENSLLMGFSFFVGFMLFMMMTQLRSRYFSMPPSVRSKSKVFSLLKTKAVAYTTAWIFINISFGLLAKTFHLDVAFCYGLQIASMVIIWFIAIVDLGRYDLALLSSAIKQWREGGDVDASLHKP
jgi:hypothetical protein